MSARVFSPRVLITGASRGIGLEFVRQYLDAGARVFAAAREPLAGELGRLAKQHPEQLQLITLDITSDADLPAAVAAVAEHAGALDVLINNAGMTIKGLTLGTYQRAAMLEVLHTNAVAPILVAQAFAALLRSGSTPRIINVSSQLGSFTWNKSGMSTLYAASKSALNMYTRSLAGEAKGIITVAVHPGWVQTDMGGKQATLTATQSVQKLRALIERLGPADNGQFFNYDGAAHPY